MPRSFPSPCSGALRAPSIFPSAVIDRRYSRLLPIRSFVILTIALAPILHCAEPAADKSLITAADLLNIKQLESPALSPDGQRIVYVVRSMEPKPDAPDSAKASADTKEDWNYQTHLWLAATDGKTPPRQLTYGAAHDSSPAWSPAGDRIALVRSKEMEKPQIHLLPLAGGEAMPLTRIETGAASPRWSPDGTKILFTSSLSYAQVRAGLKKKNQDAAPAWSSEKPRRKPNDTANWGLKDDKASAVAKPMADSSSGVAAGEKAGGRKPDAKPDGSLQEIRDWLAKNETDGNPRVTSRLNFLAEGDLAVEPEFNQFYNVAAQEGAEPEAISLGYEGYTGAAWLADGKSIVCVGPRDSKLHPDRDRLSSLWVIETATGRAKVLLEEPGCNYSEPVASPDGKWIAYAVRTGGELSFEQTMVAIVQASGGTPKVLTEPVRS